VGRVGGMGEGVHFRGMFRNGMWAAVAALGCVHGMMACGDFGTPGAATRPLGTRMSFDATTSHGTASLSVASGTERNRFSRHPAGFFLWGRCS
jgi:hypothetical protein